MTKGSSSNLLIEELTYLLQDISHLKAEGLECQSSLIPEVNYVLAWYLFNLRVATDSIASAASALEASEDKTRSLSDFIKLAETAEIVKPQRTLRDLVISHQAASIKLKITLRAYADVLEINRPVGLLTDLAIRYWNLASNNIEQAKQVYDE